MKQIYNNKINTLLIFLLCYFSLKAIIVPWSFFAASYFRMNFFDLGLISNFLTNTANGKTFFIDDSGINHLSIHWTPTLYLLAPFYRIFESQFLTIALGNIICCIGIIYFISFAYKNIVNKFSNKFFLFSSTIFITLLFFSNKYINANFTAGHFEIIFLGLSLMALTMILENRAFYIILIPFLLALGVREDMGLFLFFQILSLFFIPKKFALLEKKTKQYMLILMFICVVYVILSLKLFMPLMGASKELWANQFWSQWGNSWPEIILSVITQPLQVIKVLLNSGAPAFNESFLYLGIFNPLQWLCVHIPGMLLFLAQTTDKNHLFWYNSGMLIPGIYIVTLVGFLNIIEFLFKKFPKSINVISCSILSISAIMAIRMNRATNSDNYSIKDNKNLSEFKLAYLYINKSCSTKPTIFSTDQKTFSFLPNSSTKFLLKNYQKSEIAMISKIENTDFSIENQYENYKNEVIKIQNDEQFKLFYKNNFYLIFYNTSKIECEPS